MCIQKRLFATPSLIPKILTMAIRAVSIHGHDSTNAIPPCKMKIQIKATWTTLPYSPHDATGSVAEDDSAGSMSNGGNSVSRAFGRFTSVPIWTLSRSQGFLGAARAPTGFTDFMSQSATLLYW
jgi:hypothetical protein